MPRSKSPSSRPRRAVLGDSIYIYRLPLPPGNELRLPTREQIQRDLGQP